MAGGLTFASAPLDLRGLPPPEPMEQILHHLHTLPPGERLVALTPMKPLPLLPLLQQLGFVCEMHEMASGGACVTLCRAQDAHLLETPHPA